MKLNEILKDISAEELDVTLGSKVLIDGSTVKNTLMRLYSSFECLCVSVSDFKNCFEDFNVLYSFNLSKKLEAFESEYNPINNYDSNVEETWIYDERNSINTTGVAHSTTFNGNQHSISVDSSTTADNVNNFKNRAKTDVTSDKYVIDYDSDERTDSSHEDERTDRRIYKQSGNIGVTTSQQMIESSLSLYEKNPKLEYIRAFVYMYCYLFD